MINFLNENNNEFQNKSKQVLAYTLNKKNDGIISEGEIDENDLLTPSLGSGFGLQEYVAINNQ